MNKSLKVIFNIFAFSLVISGFIIAHKGTASAYTFLPSNLVSDTVFERSNSMSSADINTFLNSYATSCISTNNGFTTPLPLGWSDAQNKYIFGANVSAGEAIYAVSQLYHVNPQVILATLQKEQSIPTGSAGCHPNSPDPNAPFSAVPAVNTTFTCTIGGRSRTCTYACSFAGGCMNIAVGYDCPGYCNAAREGFSMQITVGTWILRFAEERSKGIMTGYVGYETGDDTLCYSGPMTPGTRQRSQVNTSCNAVVTYDGSYTTLDGVSVTIASGATAALYNFTPFVSGNHNFDNIFNSWFGPTSSSLIKTSSSTGVYLVDNGFRRGFPNEEIFLSQGYAWADVFVVSISEMDSIPLGADMPYNPNYRNWQLVRTAGSTGIYLVYNGTKRGFQNEETFISQGYKFSDVVVISTTELGLIPVGADMPYNPNYRNWQLVRTAGSTGIYLVYNGTKRGFQNEETFISQGYKFSDVVVISTTELGLIPVGADMPYNPNYRNWQLVRTAGSTGIYLVYNGTKRGFQNEETFISQGYKFSDVVVISTTELGLIPVGADMPYNPNFRNGELVKTGNSLGVYLVSNGTKRGFPTEQVFLKLGYKWADLVIISNIELNLIPTGPAMQ